MHVTLIHPYCKPLDLPEIFSVLLLSPHLIHVYSILPSSFNSGVHLVNSSYLELNFFFRRSQLTYITAYSNRCLSLVVTCNPGKQLQFDEAMTKELSQVFAADAVRRLSQEEELNLKPERFLRMRWVLTWKYIEGGDRKAKAKLVILGIQSLQGYRQQHRHLESCLVICYFKHAPCTNFVSKHRPLKSIKS